jgi:DNA-binding phage protein
MTCKASISHDQAMVKELRENPAFPAEYLRVAAEDAENPNVLWLALRRVTAGAAPRSNENG